MLKRFAVVLAALPLLAEAQASQKPAPTPQTKPAPPPSEDSTSRDRAKMREDRMKEREERRKEREARRKERMERREQRARLARTLGLAEILNLNEQQALKLRDQLATFDARRERATEQLRAARETLQRAADGDSEKPVTAAEVDQAIQRMFAARAELEAIDRDTLAALPRDLKPDQRARAAIFLQRFSNRFGPEPMVQRKVIRIPGPGMEGMHGFNLDLPRFRFEWNGMPGDEFEREFRETWEESLEGAEDL